MAKERKDDDDYIEGLERMRGNGGRGNGGRGKGYEVQTGRSGEFFLSFVFFGGGGGIREGKGRGIGDFGFGADVRYRWWGLKRGIFSFFERERDWRLWGRNGGEMGNTVDFVFELLEM